MEEHDEELKMEDKKLQLEDNNHDIKIDEKGKEIPLKSDAVVAQQQQQAVGQQM